MSLTQKSSPVRHGQTAPLEPPRSQCFKHPCALARRRNSPLADERLRYHAEVAPVEMAEFDRPSYEAKDLRKRLSVQIALASCLASQLALFSGIPTNWPTHTARNSSAYSFVIQVCSP
jgi:hypothetical protein